MSWLAAESQQVLGLVLADWWAEPVSGVHGCGANVPGYSVDLLVDWASS